MKSPNIIQNIPLGRLTSHPDNPRLSSSDEIVDQIATAIQSNGGTFDPAHAIIVRPFNGGYQIVSGHNRTEAARRAKLDTIPAWVRELDDMKALLMLVTENAQRELRPLERGLHALKCISKGSHKDGIEAYARAVGREKDSKSVQYEYHAAKVATQVRTRVPTSELLRFHRHLAEIHAAPEAAWGKLVEQLIREEWTVKETQQQVKKINDEAKKKAAKPVIMLHDWETMRYEEQLSLMEVARDFDTYPSLNRQKTEFIDWAKWSWNPITGCLHNCPYCYARDIAERLYPEKFAPTLHLDRLGSPAHTAVPLGAAQDISLRNIFTCSMADLFGKWVPELWIREVLDIVAANPQWNFLFLTKFPQRMAEFEYPPNAWLGTTIDLQARVKPAERFMRDVKASVKWLSLEPLLDPLKFEDLSQFQWIVIGGASASDQTPEWRPPQQWVYDLTSQALRAGCSVYHKTNLCELRLKQFPGDPRYVVPAEPPDVFRYLKVVE